MKTIALVTALAITTLPAITPILSAQARGGAGGVGVPAPPPQDGRLRVGAKVAEKNLVKRVEPQYPASAQEVQASVVLEAAIGKNGEILTLKIVSGHPLLNDSAIDAVKQWRYTPFRLNGETTEIVTTITLDKARG